MTEGPEVPSNGAPHYSPDGRYWWNGQQWVPAPNAVMPSATPQWVQPRQRSAFASGFLGCLGVGAAIVVVVVIIAVIGGSRGNSSGVNTHSVSSPGTAATTAPPAHVGQAIDLSSSDSGANLEVTVVKVVDPAHGSDEFNTPTAGHHFVAVQVKLTNKGSKAYEDAPGNDVKVIDGQGQSFGTTLASTTAGPGFADSQVNIAPGDSQLGFVTLEVPNADAIAKVQFTTNSGFGATGQWLVP